MSSDRLNDVEQQAIGLEEVGQHSKTDSLSENAANMEQQFAQINENKEKKPKHKKPRTRAVTHPSKSNTISQDLSDNSSLDRDKMELELEIRNLKKQLEEKQNMVETAGMLGEQLIQQNDDLQNKLNQLTKDINNKENEITEKEKRIIILSDEVTHFENESNSFHKKLIESNQMIEGLKDENIMFQKMNSPHYDTKILNQYNQTQLETELKKLFHENTVLKQCLKDEQLKCQQMLQNAEQNARESDSAKRSLNEITKRNSELINKKEEWKNKYEIEILKYNDRISDLQMENDQLISQVKEQEHYLQSTQDEIQRLHIETNNENIGESISSTIRHSLMVENDNENEITLESMGFNSEFMNPSYQTSDEPNFDQQTDKSVSVKSKSMYDQNHVEVDSKEEYIKLSVAAAKIKYHDVSISSTKLINKINEENVDFHEVSDWLNEFMLNERHKRLEWEQKRKENLNISNNTPTKQLFRRLFDKTKEIADSVTNFSTIRLEVRFGRRVFEVKMKKQDKLFTLLQTLPRIIGEDAEQMVLFVGMKQLDPHSTIQSNDLKSNDVLRMLHKNKIKSYIKRIQKKIKRASISQSIGIQDSSSVLSHQQI